MMRKPAGFFTAETQRPQRLREDMRHTDRSLGFVAQPLQAAVSALVPRHTVPDVEKRERRDESRRGRLKPAPQLNQTRGLVRNPR